MTTDDLILTAKRRLNAGTAGRAWEQFDIDIAACVSQALGELSMRVMNDDARRGLLQQSYSVTLDSDGIGNLQTATGSITLAAGEILSDGVYAGYVKDADGEVLHPIKNYPQFVSPQPLHASYYCLVNKRIHTRSRYQQVYSPADIVTVATPLTVYSSYAPANVSNVPDELTDDLVNCLCEIVLEKLVDYQEKNA